MNKVLLIISREYWTRVRRPAFLLSTFLMPIGIAAFAVLSGFIASYDGGESFRLALSDPHHLLTPTTENPKGFQISYSTLPLPQLQSLAEKDSFDAVLSLAELPKNGSTKYDPTIFTDKPLGLETSEKINSLIEKSLRNYKISQMGLNADSLKLIDVNVNIQPTPLTDKGESRTDLTAIISAAIGGVMGMIMYISVLLYGNMVMRSVMEEKMSRVVEVIISSVKPFHLLLGKILGVGAVGLTQLTIWAIFLPIIGLVVGAIVGPSLATEQMQQMQQMPQGDMAMQAMQSNIPQQILAELASFNWWLITPMFFFYFLTGYIFYAALFAAVGSAVGDDLEQSQTLVLPLTIPIVLAVYIMMATVRNPNSNLAVWSSLFPMFSPLVMPTRLPFNPPVWQIALSVILMILGCWLVIWFASRIYRVGILMYGKQVNIAELWRWFRRSE